MRSKEEALDYRYFPEPDLPPLILDEKKLLWLDEAKLEIPYDVIKKFKEEYGFHKEYINALIADKEVLNYFNEILSEFVPPLQKGGGPNTKLGVGSGDFRSEDFQKTLAKRIC